MSIDNLFNKMERDPVGFVAAGIINLIGLALVVLIIVAILNGFGVI